MLFRLKNEMYAAVIALGKIPDGERVKCAHSIKRDALDIIKNIG